MPGQSGNPNGRPRGSRNKLGEEFAAAVYAGFEQNGPDAIAKVREERPHEYLKVIAGILPKEMKVASDYSDLSDEQLIARIQQLAAYFGDQLFAGAKEEDEAAPGGAIFIEALTRTVASCRAGEITNHSRSAFTRSCDSYYLRNRALAIII